MWELVIIYTLEGEGESILNIREPLIVIHDRVRIEVGFWMIGLRAGRRGTELRESCRYEHIGTQVCARLSRRVESRVQKSVVVAREGENELREIAREGSSYRNAPRRSEGRRLRPGCVNEVRESSLELVLSSLI